MHLYLVAGLGCFTRLLSFDLQDGGRDTCYSISVDTSVGNLWDSDNPERSKYNSEKNSLKMFKIYLLRFWKGNSFINI
jgi:hypothetical protein